MADLKIRKTGPATPTPDTLTVETQTKEAGEYSQPDSRMLTEAIELLFFAYRDFISDPDEILSEYGFGRAHHRVVHFVCRHPGIPVADLLRILQITKQSLARVLKELVSQGFVIQKEGTRDRRQRLLYVSASGRELERRLAAPQHKRVAIALKAAGPDAQKLWRQVLLSLVNPEDRRNVEQLISRGHLP